MSSLSRTTLAALALFLAAAAPAAAESVKVQVTPDTFLYVSGDQATMSGEIGICAQGMYFGGTGPSSPDGWAGDPAECATRTGDTTLPPSDGGGAPAPPCTDPASCQAFFEGLLGGGGGPAPPCTDPASCQTYFGDLLGGAGGSAPPPPCADQASCQAFFEGLLGGGGGTAPPPPCTDQASCQAFFEGLLGGGGGGAPAPRDCTGATGAEATCVDFGEGNFLLGDPPDDGAGELGVCAGGTYFYVAGPGSPDGGAGEACPAAAAPADGGGSAPPPPSDGGSETTGGSQTTGGSPQTSDGGTQQQSSTQPTAADPVELPRVGIAKRRLAVSRRGRTVVPLQCESLRAECRGVLRITKTRRSDSGRRVRVVLAEAEFLVRPGRTLGRRVRLTKAGRRMMTAYGLVRATARTTLVGPSGPIVRTERIVLYRR